MQQQMEIKVANKHAVRTRRYDMREVAAEVTAYVGVGSSAPTP
jgi:hypothetical protein